MYMKSLLTGALIFSSVLLAACGSNEEKATDTNEVANEQNDKKFDDTKIENDAEFVVKAVDGGMLEVELGKLALKNAADPKVKEYAQMMIDDHTKANNELMTAAKAKNISVPTSMSDKCQKKYSGLSEKKGKDFDKDYMNAMVDGHQEMLDEMKKEADNGKDAELKKWAADKISTVSHHLDVAKTTKDALK